MRCTITLPMLLAVRYTLSDLMHHPLDAILQPLPGKRIARANVPRFVFDLFQPQPGRNLHARQRIGAVHLVGKEKDGHTPVGNVWVL